MRFIILATLLTLTTQQAFASHSDHCDVNFNGSLHLENHILTLSTQDHTQIVIDQQNQLFVEGRQITLTDEQQHWVSEYYAGIYEIAPQAAKIATDAIQIAAITVGEVFTELLGEDNDAVDDITQKLDELSKHIHSNFYAENGEIRLHSEDFNDEDFVNQQWEDEFEQAVEQVVSRSMGKIMMSIGSELLFGGGDMDAFEAKMERFGQDIEQRVEYQTSSIEARAQSLCNSLVALDEVESHLQDSVSQLSDLNILQVEENRSAM